MWCRYRKAPSLRRGLRPYDVQRDRAGTWEIQSHPPEWSPAGTASEGKPELVAPWLEVGPAHSTAEAMEGNDMVEGRGRPAGTTLEPAKGQTQRWQPLLPNLQRVNAAALATGLVIFLAAREDFLGALRTGMELRRGIRKFRPGSPASGQSSTLRKASPMGKIKVE